MNEYKIVPIEVLKQLSDLEFRGPGAADLGQILRGIISGGIKYGPSPVGRIIEPGPSNHNHHHGLSLRSYEEYTLQSVKESNGYWSEGQQVWTHPPLDDVKMLKAEIQRLMNSNYDLIQRNKVLRERVDLPVDRIPSHAELVRLQTQIESIRRIVGEE
ncbi:hypothetical protein [Pseudomonas phage Astolliot]|nr:hypothetical protein [Pseudomonas phage Astolliot]